MEENKSEKASSPELEPTDIVPGDIGLEPMMEEGLESTDVIVVTELPSSLKGSVARSSDMEVWSHLRDIAQFHDPKEVELLIGLDIPQALVPLEVRSGKDGEPFTTRTLLGWTINGPIGLDGHDATAVNSHVTTTTAENQRKYLDHQVNLVWELNATKNCDDPISVEDKRVTKLWSENVVQVDGHYQLPIPFRNKNPDLPDNKDLAERRLESLRRRHVKHLELFVRYQEEMSRLLSEGHSERVPSL
ncbi:hypothetical protein E2C01_053390 [Portunus trituberculatus]|uniref:Peptidase aspartic putative domain-containing protein n=1 Tax=Portunus trituberculatus TaxID=210409 RepID=A0A5B7GGZ6_PORTR|nr:hypothetical protein [Portunus trituberculatus]